LKKSQRQPAKGCGFSAAKPRRREYGSTQIRITFSVVGYITSTAIRQQPTFNVGHNPRAAIDSCGALVSHPSDFSDQVTDRRNQVAPYIVILRADCLLAECARGACCYRNLSVERCQPRVKRFRCDISATNFLFISHDFSSFASVRARRLSPVALV
jgi:hypothetical protein